MKLQAPASVAILTVLLALCIPSHAAVFQDYPGNQNASFDGSVGNGSLNFTDNGSTLQCTFTKGASGSFGNYLVLYIDSVSGGFANTSQFYDCESTGSGIRTAISGYNSGGGRATATFKQGFLADYALVLSKGSGSGLYQLAGGAGSHTLIQSFSPDDHGNGTAYTVNLNWASIGLSTSHGFTFESTYIRETGWRSLESFEYLTGDSAIGTGHQITFTGYDTFGVAPVPEPANLALGTFAAMVLGAGAFRSWRRYKVRLRPVPAVASSIVRLH